MTYKDIMKNAEVLQLIKKGSDNLKILGYTDHSEKHTTIVAKNAAYILDALNYDKHMIELVKIAGFLHDVGNAINRKSHAEYGALLVNDILKETDLNIQDRIDIVSAIAHHDESTGGANDVLSAALIIADKCDVRRERVNQKDKTLFDIHDRVNYAVTANKLRVDIDKKVISLNLQIDENICTMYEYFDIFLGRMIMCRGAAELLNMHFKLTANGRKVL